MKPEPTFYLAGIASGGDLKISMIEHAVNFAILIPAIVIAFFPMRGHLNIPIKHLIIIWSIAFLILIPLMAWTALALSLPPNLLLLPALVLLFALFHYSLRVPFCKSLSVFLSVISLGAILGLYASFIDSRFHPSLGSDSYTFLYGIVHFTFLTFACLLLAYPMSHYGGRLIDNLNIQTPWLCTLPFSLLLTGMTHLMRPLKYETMYVNRVSTAIFFITNLLLVLWLLLLVIFYFITTSLIRSAKVKEEKQLLEFRESQFVAQTRYIEATRRELHDFRQSLRVLRELFDAGDMESLGHYLSQYEQSQPVNDIQSFCSNSALNAVLNFYSQQATRNGIDLRISISYPSRPLPISDVALCNLTGNLLENAITAAGKTTDKWVELKMTTVNQSMLVILTTNPFDGHLRIRNGRYLSTTRSGDGIGLASISTIAESHGGYAQFSHKDHLFYCNIAIPL